MSTQLVAVYIALILFIVTFYYLSRRAKKKTGHALQFKDWLQQILGNPARGNSQSATNATKSDAQTTEDYQEVLDIVNDIYRDVYGVSDQLRVELFQKLAEDHHKLELQLLDLRQEIDRLKQTTDGAFSNKLQPNEAKAKVVNSADSETKQVNAQARPVANPAVPSPLEQTDAAFRNHPVYFQILDQLQSGNAPNQIAKNLGITVAEVEVVHRLMKPVMQKD